MSPKLRSALALVAFLAISAAVAAFGAVVNAGTVEGWYAQAEKPPWTPPGWLFGPVWSLLYALMSVAAWLVWRRRAHPAARGALVLYVVQLVANALWTPVFFGAVPLIGSAALWIGLVIIVALDVLVVATIVRFARVRPLAAGLLVPYACWVLFATTLNAGIAILNT